MPAPFLSLLIDDCIARGKDYHDGGARYNTSYIQGVGLGTITDALTALKFHVFDRQTLSMEALLTALERQLRRSKNACGNCCSIARRATATTTTTPTA